MVTTIRNVTVDVLVVTNKGERQRRVDMVDDEDCAAFVGRVGDVLRELGAGSGATSATTRAFVQLARTVAEEWGDQEGVNRQRLDDLATAYTQMVNEEDDDVG